MSLLQRIPDPFYLTVTGLHLPVIPIAGIPLSLVCLLGKFSLNAATKEQQCVFVHISYLALAFVTCKLSYMTGKSVSCGKIFAMSIG